MDNLMEHVIVGIAVMFVIVACRVFQAHVFALYCSNLVGQNQ